MRRYAFDKPSLRAIAGAIGTGLLTLGYVSQAEAFTTIPSLQSHVSDSVTDNGDGSWTYEFTVHNDTSDFYGGDDFYGGVDIIVDWELPYFDDMGITDILSPNGWAFAIETIGTPNSTTGWGGEANWQKDGDPWKNIFDAQYGSAAANPFNTHTQVLHWYIPDDQMGCESSCNEDFGIFPMNALSGFSFDAAFGEGQAPYQASWDQGQIQTGDPFFPQAGTLALPNSPSINPVPLPGAAILMLSGLAGLAGFSRRKAN